MKKKTGDPLIFALSAFIFVNCMIGEAKSKMQMKKKLIEFLVDFCNY